MIKKIIKLMLIVIWMGLIFIFSSDTGSESTRKSDGFIIKIVEIFYSRDLTNLEKEKWTNYLVIPVRKGAHLGVYLILGILILSFIQEFMSINYKSVLLSIGISFLYACSDEIHQYFVPGRSGMISDVILDTIGACIGIFLIGFVVRKCKRREQKERIS